MNHTAFYLCMQSLAQPLPMLLESLPTELLVRVLTQLDLESLSQCDQTSRLFHNPDSAVEQALRQLASEDGLVVPNRLPRIHPNWTQALLVVAMQRRAHRDGPGNELVEGIAEAVRRCSVSPNVLARRLRMFGAFDFLSDLWGLYASRLELEPNRAGNDLVEGNAEEIRLVSVSSSIVFTPSWLRSDALSNFSCLYASRVRGLVKGDVQQARPRPNKPCVE